MKKVFAAIVIILILFSPIAAQKVAAAQGEWVEWIADAQLSYASIDNLNLSAFSDDTQGDDQVALNGIVGRFYQFNGFTRMSFVLELDIEKYQEFDAMDNQQLGVNFGVRHKFGLGFYQPYVQFNASYRHKEVEWDANSMDTAFSSIEVGRHITDQLSLAASIDYTSTDGEAWTVIVPELSSEVFNQDFIHVSLFADYILSENWLVSGSYAHRQGDFQSSCSKENVAIVLEVEQVKAITSDPVFGGCIYKLDGSSNIYSASLSYSLSSHSGLNFDIEHYQGKADVLDYHRTSYSLSFNYRY